MKGKTTVHQVSGQLYEVWSDYIMRGTYARNEQGEIRRISGGGYLHNDLTIRKAIAAVYGLHTFRK